jgi:hypothetical protein
MSNADKSETPARQPLQKTPVRRDTLASLQGGPSWRTRGKTAAQKRNPVRRTPEGAHGSPLGPVETCPADEGHQ